MSHWKKFLKDESGPSTVEYAILLSLLVLTSVGTLGALGIGIKTVFTTINTTLSN